MNILFVSAFTDPRVPPINGDAQRTRLLYEACTKVAEVDVISFVGQRKSKSHQPKWKKWAVVLPFADITSLFPVNPTWEAVINDFVQKKHYDFIVSRYFYRAIPCGLWKFRDRLIVDFDDALPFYFLNQINQSSSLSTRIRLKIAARRANAISRRAIKELHAAFFAKKETALSNNGIYLPNIPFYNEHCSDADLTKHRILFVGQLEYQPNTEGLNYFLEHIYRPLYLRITGLEMHIVGLISNKALRQRWESYPNVTVTGFVDDLRGEYEDCQVVVVPVWRCGATNIKILEAMSMNRACVATREVYDPFRDQFVDKRDLYVADNDEAFVESVYRLLTDKTENRRVAHNAQKAMESYYSFDAFAGIVKSVLQ